MPSLESTLMQGKTAECLTIKIIVHFMTFSLLLLCVFRERAGDTHKAWAVGGNIIVKNGSYGKRTHTDARREGKIHFLVLPTFILCVTVTFCLHCFSSFLLSRAPAKEKCHKHDRILHMQIENHKSLVFPLLSLLLFKYTHSFLSL